MQGLITLDFGNSNPHAGIFQKNAGGWSLLKVVPIAELSLYLSQLQMSAHNTSVVLAQVRPREEQIQKLQEQGFLVERVKDYWRGKKFAGMPVHYADTLGEDRLIAAHFCFKTKKVPTLIIDAGTFTTMDVVTPEGFLGGYIIPGVRTFQESFRWGDQLRSVELSCEMKPELPQSTPEAMSLSYSAFGELAMKLIKKHRIERLVLSGGNLELWKNYFLSLNLEIPCDVKPHLIHEALQHWMMTQIEPL